MKVFCLLLANRNDSYDNRNESQEWPVPQRTCETMHQWNMASNIDQIFQDFILNKIKEIHDRHHDKT